MAKKVVQKWPNFCINCDCLSNNGIHYFLFLSFYIGTKTKKEKYSCMSADIIAFLFACLSHTLYLSAIELLPFRFYKYLAGS